MASNNNHENIPEGWEVKQLKEITLMIFSGGTPDTRIKDYWGGVLPWLSSGETRQTFIRDTDRKITKAGVDNSSTRLANKYDVVVAGAGQGYTRGQPSICLIDTYVNQSVVVLRANREKTMPFLLYYNLLSRYDELRQISDAHSIRGSLTTKLLADLPIVLPPLEEQEIISEILSNLDFKIELNQQMNKTLEAIAQVLFKHWFIDFEFPDENGKPYRSSGGKMVDSELGLIPEGWEVRSLDECADFLNGLALQKYPAKDGEDYLPVIKIRELRQGITESVDKANMNVPKEYVINDGDILFSWSGSLEVVIWGFGRGALNQHLFKVTSAICPKWFIYYWIIHFLPEYRAIASDKATTMGHIQRHHLSASKVVVPDDATLKRMNVILNPIVERISQLKVETRLLSELRDYLLPKLMSGKIRVPVSETRVG